MYYSTFKMFETWIVFQYRHSQYPISYAQYISIIFEIVASAAVMLVRCLCVTNPFYIFKSWYMGWWNIQIIIFTPLSIILMYLLFSITKKQSYLKAWEICFKRLGVVFSSSDLPTLRKETSSNNRTL